ncbi:MAG: hypothetical protein FWB95_02175 [Treponema sp.]|nr:hypothetical protein [Treponema sp.]
MENDRRSRRPVIGLLAISLAVSLASLIVYIIDPEFSDETLFLLLNIIQYSSFMVCVCSLYKLLESSYYIITRPARARHIRIAPYIIFIIYGLAAIFMEAFIVAISRGNA